MSRHTPMLERVEPRRLFADFALDIDESLSTVSASGTVGGFAIAADDTTTQIDGTLNVSSTARGIKLLSGSDITISTTTSDTAFNFVVAPGRTIVLNDFGGSLQSRRLRVTDGKFNTNSIVGTLDGPTISDGANTGTFDGTTADDAYSVGKVQTGTDKLRLIIPFTMNATTTYTVNGASTPLNVIVTGQLVARGGPGATGAAFVAKTAEADAMKKNRVADSVVG